MLRYYQVDLLDLYRGGLSPRRLGVLIRHLPADSALVREMHGGRPPWSQLEHLIADLWALTLRINSDKTAAVQDHPTRAAMEAAARAEEKQQRLAELQAKYRNRKRAYGLE